MEDLGSRLSPENAPRGSVAIVGAGWAGLSAAVMLAASGVPPTLFEASRQLGGRARRVAVDGASLDNGQHILIGAYLDTLAMLHRVGVDTGAALARLPLELRYADGFHLRASRLPYPLNLLTGLLGATGLPLPAVWAAVRMMWRLRRAGFRVEPDRPVAQFLTEQGQHGKACRYLWGPLCVSALNTPSGLASARVFARVLRDGLTGSRAASDLLIPRVDLGNLFPDPAAEFITRRGGRVCTGSAVRSIRRDRRGFVLDGGSERFAAVIVACGPQHAAALLSEFADLDATRKAINALEYQPIVTCYLQFPGPLALPAPMLGFQGGLIQWIFDRGQLGGPQGLLAIVISASGAHDDLDRDALADALESELRASPVAALRALPRRSAVQVIAEKRATFACTPDLPRPPMATPVAGLLLAGDYVAGDYPGTLESAVRSGAAAARAASLLTIPNS